MGLSNEERFSRMVWTAHHITEETEQLRSVQDDSGYDGVLRVRRLCDQVWPALLGGTNNSLHWLLGSSVVNDLKEGEGPWAIALCAHFREDGWLEEAGRRRREHYQELSDAERDRTGDPAREDQEDEDSSVDGLLGALQDQYDPPGLQEVYRIFAHTETMVYALRRYGDEFRKKFSQLDELISNLQGACFAVFATSAQYAKAYLLSQILSELRQDFRLVSNKMAWCRRVSDWLKQHRYVPLEDLKELHRSMFDEGGRTLEAWVRRILSISAPHKQEFGSLKRVLQANEIQADLDLLEQLYREAREKVEQEEKERNDRRKDDGLYHCLCAIHGYSVAAELTKKKKEAEEAKEQKDGAESHRVDEAPVPIAE